MLVARWEPQEPWLVQLVLLPEVEWVLAVVVVELVPPRKVLVRSVLALLRTKKH